METYLGYKAEIDFNGSLIDTIKAIPEETRAIVRKDNGKFAIAEYCYNRFGEGSHWVIWGDDEYGTQFKAMIEIGAVKFNTYLKKWLIQDNVIHIK